MHGSQIIHYLFYTRAKGMVPVAKKVKVIVRLLQLVPNQLVELSKNYKHFKVSGFEMKENPKHFNATTNSPQGKSKIKPIWG
jgi:hypothetical protein